MDNPQARPSLKRFSYEYLAIIVGFVFLMGSIAFLVLQNRDLILLEDTSARLYENIRAIDTAFIQVFETGTAARKVASSKRAQDLSVFLSNERESMRLLDSAEKKIAEDMGDKTYNDIKQIFSTVLQRLQKTLRGLHDTIATVSVDAGRTSAAAGDPGAHASEEVTALLETIYDLHRTKLVAADHLIELKSENLARTIAGNNLRSAAGTAFAFGFFLLAFFLLRHKTQLIRQYSARLEAETDRAQHAERVKSEFLANMSHEIRTPMTAILGFGELLNDGVQDPKYRSYLSGIQTSGKALLALINDLLDLSKIEAGRMTIVPRKTDLPGFLSELELIFDQMARNKGLKFSMEHSADVPKSIMVDDNRLRQILINLLGNAVKFTPKGFVRCAVSTDREASTQSPTLRFDIIDSGIGISAKDQTIIFDAFRQVDGQASRNFGGTGLGLSISLRLAHLLGGSITVKSEPGRGSVFSLIIPLHEVGEGTNAEEGARGATPGTSDDELEFRLTGGRVLIVEDEPYNRTILQEFLGNQGVQVLSAANGEEALSILQSQPIDVVVTDIMMPVMSGFELIKNLRQSDRFKSMPIIIASASTPPEQFKNLPGIQGFLKKPFHRIDLLEYLSGYLPHERLRRPVTPEAGQGGEDFLKNAPSQLGSRLESVRKGLSDAYGQRFRQLQVTLAVDDVSAFGTELAAEGMAANFRVLSDYGRALIQAAASMDIEAITRLFVQFETFLHARGNGQN